MRADEAGAGRNPAAGFRTPANVQSIVGPLLQPLALAGLVIVFVVMILLEREDPRDRLLRLAGRRDLHRTTVAMDDAASRMSRYLSRQLVVNACCGLPIGIGLALIGIPNAALWGIFAALLRFLPYPGLSLPRAFLSPSPWRWTPAGCYWSG